MGRLAKKEKALQMESEAEKEILDKITAEFFADLLFQKAWNGLPKEVREALPTMTQPDDTLIDSQKARDVLARLFATKEGKDMVIQTIIKHLSQLEEWEEARVKRAERQEQIEEANHEERAHKIQIHRQAKEPKKKKERKAPKNRLGQRARRELYEKEFGEQANHIKKGEEWVSKEMQPLNRKMKRAKEREAQAQTKNTSLDPTLHPSWKAKMAQKEAIEARLKEVATVKPTKIRFDDD